MISFACAPAAVLPVDKPSATYFGATLIESIATLNAMLEAKDEVLPTIEVKAGDVLRAKLLSDRWIGCEELHQFMELIGAY